MFSRAGMFIRINKVFGKNDKKMPGYCCMLTHFFHFDVGFTLYLLNILFK